MKTKIAALLLPLALAGCWESEQSCYERLDNELESFLEFVKKNYSEREYKETRYSLIDTQSMLFQIKMSIEVTNFFQVT
jgi:hypothetical protein